MATAADVLNTSDRQQIGGRRDTITLELKIRRFNPEVSEESWWSEFSVECDPLDRLVEATRVVEVAFDGAEGGGETFRLDRTEAFRDWSASAGVRTEWSVLRLAVFAEAWLGLVNLDVERWNEVHQHQVRLGVGYRL